MKIKVLETTLSNMIAAGEVVERPASVVKELAENSIDAGATNIIVEIEQGGVKYIRVSDNGCGILKEDAKTAFLRHATSKISTPEDLNAILTLGFRGEALASIAAVARVELCTRIYNQGFGTRVEVTAGEFTDESETGCPQGTTIIVNNLFFNTPARVKFLKSDRTEASYVEETVRRLAFAHPEVSFKFISDGKERLFTSGDNNLYNVVYNIYGNDYVGSMVNVEHTDGNIKVKGLIGLPNVYRKNRTYQSFYINGRYIINRTMSAALEEAFKGSMVNGLFPIAVLHLTVPPSFVDINVHPAKLEAKFADDSMVFSAIYHACKNTLLKNNSTVKSVGEGVINTRAEHNSPSYSAVAAQPLVLKEGHEIIKTQEAPTKPAVNINTVSIRDNQAIPPEIIPKNISVYQEQRIEGTEHSKLTDYKLLGQLFSTYIVFEMQGQAFLIDQHAAHERLIYERLIKEYRDKGPMPQQLLTAVIVELSPLEFSLYKENGEFFNQLGFEINEFGNNSIAVRMLPIALDIGLIKDVVIDILGTISKNKISALEIIREKALYTVACKAAVKANRKMGEFEMRALIKDVLSLEEANTCPHGRPLMIALSKAFIEKQFKRIV